MRAPHNATRRPGVALGLAVAVFALWATGLQPADAVTVVKRALSAKNADAVDKLSASKAPRPGRLLALGGNGKFPKSVIPSGASRGPRGSQGPAGAAGSDGQRGPSDAYADNGDGTPLSTQANVDTTVAKLSDLPAGSYALSSVAQAGDFINGGEIVSCDIRVNGMTLRGSSVVVGSGAGSARSTVLSAAASVTRTSPFDVTLECRSDQSLAQPPGVQNQYLTAIRVASTHGPG